MITVDNVKFESNVLESKLVEYSNEMNQDLVKSMFVRLTSLLTNSLMIFYGREANDIYKLKREQCSILFTNWSNKRNDGEREREDELRSD